MDAVAIIGSREWPRPDRVIDYVNLLPPNTVVITGGWWRNGVIEPTRGVDRIAATAAQARGLTVVVVAADYGRYQKQAGMRRNPVTVGLAKRVVAFWDGKSPGTKNSIDHADRLGIPVETIL